MLTLVRKPTTVAVMEEMTIPQMRALIERIRRMNPRWEKGISYRFGVLSRPGVTRYAVTGQTDQGFTVVLFDREWTDYQVPGLVYKWPEPPGERVLSVYINVYDNESGEWSCNVECCQRWPPSGESARYVPSHERFELLYEFVRESATLPLGWRSAQELWRGGIRHEAGCSVRLNLEVVLPTTLRFTSDRLPVLRRAVKPSARGGGGRACGPGGPGGTPTGPYSQNCVPSIFWPGRV